MSALRLVGFYLGSASDSIEALADKLGRTFGLDARVETPQFDPETCLDSSRRQYNSTLLLRELLAAPRDDVTRILGLTSVDLFIPILTYVFGEAQLGGVAAVVSTYRLHNELYGLPADKGLLAARITKECIHELGHTYGLVHCLRPGCVMQSSTYVEEIDIKSDEFCASCQSRVRVGGA